MHFYTILYFGKKCILQQKSSRTKTDYVSWTKLSVPIPIHESIMAAIRSSGIESKIDIAWMFYLLTWIIININLKTVQQKKGNFAKEKLSEKLCWNEKIIIIANSFAFIGNFDFMNIVTFYCILISKICLLSYTIIKHNI